MDTRMHKRIAYTYLLDTMQAVLRRKFILPVLYIRFESDQIPADGSYTCDSASVWGPINKDNREMLREGNHIYFKDMSPGLSTTSREWLDCTGLSCVSSWYNLDHERKEP